MSKSAFLIAFLLPCLVLASQASAVDEFDLANAVGKQVEIKMDNDAEYIGTLEQVNLDTISLKDVSALKAHARGVPFMNVVRDNKNSKMFKNVGPLFEKLEYGIVIPKKGILSIELGGLNESQTDPNQKTANQEKPARQKRSEHLLEITRWLLVDRDLTEEERANVIRELELLRESLFK